MLDCLILGDSIAEGVRQALHAAALDRCAVVAKVGASSAWAARNVPAGRFRTIAIATGSNDAAVPSLPDRLASIRRAVSAPRILWIAPYDRRAAIRVVAVARTHGDQWMDMAELPSRDGIHPRSYAQLAAALRRTGYAGR